MVDTKYICVVCGHSVDALFRQYGPTVLKVTNCERCGSISDKYIEYDPVIIMVDMVLLSKEAYRHVLYNTSFKAFWKLFIILLLMDTYLDWANNSYYEKYKKDQSDVPMDCNTDELLLQDVLIKKNNFSTTVSGIQKNNTSETVDEKHCVYKGKTDTKDGIKSSLNEDPFLTEKGIYLTFCCVCFGMFAFLLAVFILSIFFRPYSTRKNKVDFILLMKGLTLGGMGNLFMLPTIIWGSDQDSTIHSPLVLGYTTLAITTIHSVIFECSKFNSFFILALSFILKISTRTQLRNFSQFYL